MPQCNLAIKDTVTGLWLKVYSPSLEACQFGSAQDALCVDNLTQQEVQAIIDNLNGQAGTDRFIGSNPPPR